MDERTQNIRKDIVGLTACIDKQNGRVRQNTLSIVELKTWVKLVAGFSGFGFLVVGILKAVGVI